jgi:hypothetical protein
MPGFCHGKPVWGESLLESGLTTKKRSNKEALRNPWFEILCVFVPWLFNPAVVAVKSFRAVLAGEVWLRRMAGWALDVINAVR